MNQLRSNYKEIRIYAHQRSGSNYLAELIDANFVKSGNYKSVYGGHVLPDKVDLSNKEITFIYLYRDFDAVSKSIFKLRYTFGLDVNNYEVFLKSKYSEMYNAHLKPIHKVSHHGKVHHESRVSEYFRSIEMLPEEFHTFHIEEWLKYKNADMCCCKI